MIIELDAKYRENYCQMEMCKRWKNGIEIEWDETPFLINDYPIAFVKGDHGSQIETHNTSIKMTDFNEFAKQCTGNVYIGTARLIFEREIVIGFDDNMDAIAFKLRFS